MTPTRRDFLGLGTITDNQKNISINVLKPIIEDDNQQSTLYFKKTLIKLTSHFPNGEGGRSFFIYLYSNFQWLLFRTKT